MIFADKLIALRKKCGWTQEELAERMDVSRQSIAKWECAQSVPELKKIVRLSELFGVSTDYLLKDDVDAVCASEDAGETPVRRIDLAEAQAFLAARRAAAKPIALGVMLCILSPIALILLGVVSEMGRLALSEGAAAGIGMIALLVLVGIALALFITTGNRNAMYEFLEKEAFETAYGVDGMAAERRADYKRVYDTGNVIGTLICLFAILPIFLALAFELEDDVTMTVAVSLMFALASIGVFLLVRVGVVWASFEKLLQSGDYSRQKKRERNSVVGAVASAYWLVAVAVFLVLGFTGGWGTNWLVFAVAGVLYPALMGILRGAIRREK